MLKTDKKLTGKVFADNQLPQDVELTVKFDTENGGQLSVKDLHKLLPEEQAGE